MLHDLGSVLCFFTPDIERGACCLGVHKVFGPEELKGEAIALGGCGGRDLVRAGTSESSVTGPVLVLGLELVVVDVLEALGTRDSLDGKFCC